MFPGNKEDDLGNWNRESRMDTDAQPSPQTNPTEVPATETQVPKVNPVEHPDTQTDDGAGLRFTSPDEQRPDVFPEEAQNPGGEDPTPLKPQP